MYFSRRLSSGKLQDLGITDGSKLTLVPTVEAGLMVNECWAFSHQFNPVQSSALTMSDSCLCGNFFFFFFCKVSSIKTRAVGHAGFGESDWNPGKHYTCVSCVVLDVCAVLFGGGVVRRCAWHDLQIFSWNTGCNGRHHEHLTLRPPHA